jgi:putative hydrolase of the HAD superfamily
MVKAVTFDIDDTLFSRHEAQRQTLRIIVREFSHIFAGLNEEAIANAFFEADLEAIKAMDNGVSIKDSRVIRSKKFLSLLDLDQKYADAVNELYLKTYPLINIPVEGVLIMLKQIAGKFQLGVVSNGSPDVQYRKLEKLGIKDIFDCIIISDEVKVRKPDPRIFQIAAERLNIKPEKCLHIGDSYSADVVGAQNAGFMSCWFNPDNSQRSEVNIKPDFEIKSFDEIFANIPDLNLV